MWHSFFLFGGWGGGLKGGTGVWGWVVRVVRPRPPIGQSEASILGGFGFPTNERGGAG